MTEIFRRNIQVDNVTDALTAIQAALAEAGWSTITGSPTQFPLMMGSGTIVNSVRIFVRFTNPTANVLRLNGDALGDGISLSINRDWTLSPGSRLWLAVDGDAFCCLIKPTSGNGFAYHAGRLEPLLPDDGWAAQVGSLSTTTDSSGSVCQFMQQWNSTIKWRLVGSTPTNNKGVFSNVFDGNIDPITGKPEISAYFRFGTLAGSEFRGVVKFAVTGLNHKSSGIEFEGQGGIVYVATGDGGFRVS